MPDMTGAAAKNHRRAWQRRDPSSPPLRLPCGLDDVTVRVAALDTHVIRLVPLFDQLDAVRGEPVAQRADGLAIAHPDAEVHPGGWGDPHLSQTERERESLRVVEHQDAVVVPPRRPGPEAEIGLVQAARALLVSDGNREVVHRRETLGDAADPPRPFEVGLQPQSCRDLGRSWSPW